MKKVIILLCITSIGFMSLYAETQKGAASSDTSINSAFEKAGLPLLNGKQPVRDFELNLLDGSSVRLSDLKGKVVFLNFWATWCPPCRAEMPSMEALYQRFKDQGLEMIAVNMRENRDRVAGFMTEYKLTFPAALSLDGRIGNAYGVQYLPTTLIIDRNNEIILSFIGTKEWDTPEIIAAFELLLN